MKGIIQGLVICFAGLDPEDTALGVILLNKGFMPAAQAINQYYTISL
jgi:hypothetical protein